MSLPVTVVILEPSDRKWKYSPSQVKGVVMSEVAREQRWLRDRVESTYDHDLIWHKSKHDAAYLALEAATGKDWRDQNGEGCDTGKIVHDVVQVEMGIPPEKCRVKVFYSNGGGYAGGSYNPTIDHGYCIVGDHFMKMVPDRNPDNSVVRRSDGTIKMVRNLPYVSHEWMHSFNVSCHPDFGGVVQYTPDGLPVPFYLEPIKGQTLSVGQKMELFAANYRFLKEVAA